MTKIRDAFKDGKAFIPFLTCGDPDLETTEKLVCAMAEAGADLITVHLEACPDVRKTLTEIKDLGIMAGLSICPETPVEEIREYLEYVDMILIMSVHPGAGGQKFMEESLDRIRETEK